MGESAEGRYRELADAARALLEAEAACNAVLAREHLSSELSDAIGRIVDARDELHALLAMARRRARLDRAAGSGYRTVGSTLASGTHLRLTRARGRAAAES